MSWLDWKVRDVVGWAGAAGVAIGVFVGGHFLSYDLLTLLGQRPPEDLDGLLLGSLVAAYSGLGLGYAFVVQVRHRGMPRGLVSGLLITTGSVAAASCLQGLMLWIPNELFAMAVGLPLMLLGQTLIVGAWWVWLRLDRWMQDELTGKNGRERLQRRLIEEVSRYRSTP